MRQKDEDGRRWRRLLDKSKIVEASDEELDQIDPIPKDVTPAGGRYHPIFQVDTELSSTMNGFYNLNNRK